MTIDQNPSGHPMSITVVMATYNGEQFIHEQIDSILAQTFQPEMIICVDDCSTDKTREILAEYANIFPTKFIIIHNGENIGSRKSFEKGVTFVKTPFLAFSDQDDWWYPHKLKQLHTALITSNNLAFVYSNACETDANLNVLHDTYLKEGTNFLDGSSFYQVLTNNTVVGCSMLARTEFVQRSQPFPHTGFHHDWYLAIRALAANHAIKYIPESLFKYRRHANNQVNNTGSVVVEKPYSELLRDSLRELSNLPEFHSDNPVLSRLIALKKDLLESIFSKKPVRGMIRWCQYYSLLKTVSDISIKAMKKEIFSIFKVLVYDKW